MRKNVFGRKLKRDIHERKALFKSLLSSLVLEEKIVTTEAKAKAIKARAEKLVTKARKGGLAAESDLRAYLIEKAVRKMMSDIAPRFATRPGGYTRLVKLPNRFSDNAAMVAMEWVEKRAEKPASSKTPSSPDTTEATIETATPEEKKKVTPKKTEKKATKTKKETK